MCKILIHRKIRKQTIANGVEVIQSLAFSLWLQFTAFHCNVFRRLLVTFIQIRKKKFDSQEN